MNSFMQLHSATHGRCSIDRKHAFGNLKSHWDLQVVTVGAVGSVLHQLTIPKQVVAERCLETPDVFRHQPLRKVYAFQKNGHGKIPASHKVERQI
jgi:hypothetical protein